ncbi:MAG: hypothetical protein CM15mP93_01610 [Thiotrichaceae bacterium]|nr:MAG: hypothetical protein CM15mP93_01610 [Thiotrichaceae bacterium]
MTFPGAKVYQLKNLKILAADKNHEIKAVVCCHNETATGVTSDIEGLRKAMDQVKHPALLMVDGVSSIASIPFRFDKWKIDIAVSGSQKDLCYQQVWLFYVLVKSTSNEENCKMQKMLPRHSRPY